MALVVSSAVAFGGGEAKGADVWEFVAPMNVKRKTPSVALGSDGFIYVSGGVLEPGEIALNSVERYDHNADTWEFVAPLNEFRRNHESIKVGGVMYAIGGTDGTNFLDTMETYNPLNDEWTTSPHTLNIPRGNFGLTKGHDGKIYAIGGNDNAGFSEFTETVEVFDTLHPNSGWQMLGHDLSSVRGFLGAGTDSLGRIYAIEGVTEPDRSIANIVEVFDPSNPGDGWVLGADIGEIGKVGAYATSGDRKIYVIGEDQKALMVYNLESDSWVHHSNKILGFDDFAMVFGPFGRAYVVGGEDISVERTVAGFGGFEVPDPEIPEPSTLGLVGALGVLGALGRRKR